MEYASDFRPGDLAVCVVAPGDTYQGKIRWRGKEFNADGLMPVKGSIYTVTKNLGKGKSIRYAYDALLFAELNCDSNCGYNSMAFRRLLRKEEIEEVRRYRHANKGVPNTMNCRSIQVPERLR
jgi:hypothetical protein